MGTASRLEIEELPDDWRKWCQDNRPDLISRDVFEEFRDYWTAKAGPDARKLDWFATWRNWIRKIPVKRAPPSVAPARPIRDTSKPLPERSDPNSPAYLAFKANFRKLMRTPGAAPIVGTFATPLGALALQTPGERSRAQSEAEREAAEERAAMQAGF